MNYTSPTRTDFTITRTVATTPAEVCDVWLDAKSPGGPWFEVKRVIWGGLHDPAALAVSAASEDAK